MINYQRMLNLVVCETFTANPYSILYWTEKNWEHYFVKKNNFKSFKVNSNFTICYDSSERFPRLLTSSIGNAKSDVYIPCLPYKISHKKKCKSLSLSDSWCLCLAFLRLLIENNETGLNRLKLNCFLKTVFKCVCVCVCVRERKRERESDR